MTIIFAVQELLLKNRIVHFFAGARDSRHSQITCPVRLLAGTPENRSHNFMLEDDLQITMLEDRLASSTMASNGSLENLTSCVDWNIRIVMVGPMSRMCLLTAWTVHSMDWVPARSIAMLRSGTTASPKLGLLDDKKELTSCIDMKH